jgi:hypothetical protein
MKYSIVIAVLLYAGTASAHCPSQRYYRSGDGQYQCSDGAHDHISEDEIEKPSWSLFQLYVVPGRTYPPPRHYHHRSHRHSKYDHNNHDRHPKTTKARRKHHRRTYHKGERKKTKSRKQRRKSKARRK